MSVTRQEIRPPVALFIYARPEHTRRSIEGLARANGAKETDLIVFADGPRKADDVARVEAARKVVRQATGFRTIELIEREENIRPVRNIISGVTEVIGRHGCVIVMEDDILPARGFLDYMAAALEHYAEDNRVWHISGWNYPIDPVGLPPYFFWTVMNCWGWATWQDRWVHYHRDTASVSRWSRKQVRAFNLDGCHNFFAQIVDHKSGITNPWDIYWYATIFEHNGLCLQPTRSLVQNIGLDGSGEHCVAGPDAPIDLEMQFTGGLPNVEINQEAVDRIKRFLKRPMHRQFMIRRRSKRLHNFIARAFRSDSKK